MNLRSETIFYHYKTNFFWIRVKKLILGMFKICNVEYLSWNRIRCEDVRINLLQDSNAEKDAKIIELQGNLGGLIAFYYDMNRKLVRRFSDCFKNVNVLDDQECYDFG